MSFLPLFVMPSSTHRACLMWAIDQHLPRFATSVRANLEMAALGMVRISANVTDDFGNVTGLRGRY